MQRDTPYALVALVGAMTFVLFHWLGAEQLISAVACMVVVLAGRGPGVRDPAR